MIICLVSLIALISSVTPAHGYLSYYRSRSSREKPPPLPLLPKPSVLSRQGSSYLSHQGHAHGSSQGHIHESTQGYTHRSVHEHAHKPTQGHIHGSARPVEHSSVRYHSGGYQSPGRKPPRPSTLGPSQSTGSYLNPSNFHLPNLNVQEMETIAGQIEAHTKSKDGNNAMDYTGSRLLIILLREECSRLLQIGDESVNVFCNQFQSKFRSFFF